VSDLNEQQRYNLKHREIYYSKYTDTIAATTIRAKCSVLLFNEEVERYSDFLNREVIIIIITNKYSNNKSLIFFPIIFKDAFFYHLTYDPYQKSIVADKGEIRVGQRYQSEIPQLKVSSTTTTNGIASTTGSCTDGSNSDSNSAQSTANEISKNYDRVLRSQLQRASSSSNGSAKDAASKEQMPEVPISAQVDDPFIWCPLNTILGGFSNNLTDYEIDQFLIIAKSVGTYARALDCGSAFKQPSLALSAASASRDITLVKIKICTYIKMIIIIIEMNY